MKNKQDDYAILGVPRGASREEIEKRYAELQRLFSSTAIPEDLGDWVASQLDLVRQAYLELTGEVPAETEEAEDTLPQPTLFQRVLERPLFMAALGVVLGLLVLGGFFGVQAWMGREDTTPPPVQGAAIDQARVKELEAALRQEPNNQDALLEMGDIYLMAERWDEAARWYGRLLEVNPNHVYATIDLGTAQFYLGRPGMSKMLWARATELDPQNAEAHFNLGILYSVIEPTDPEAAQREWEKVLELDPESSLAEIVRQHMQFSATPEPTPVGTATP